MLRKLFRIYQTPSSTLRRRNKVRAKINNASENLHKELEKIRINSGGYFQSEKILFAKWAIFIKNLHSKKWLKPEPYFKANLQSLHLLFQHTFQCYDIKNEKNYIQNGHKIIEKCFYPAFFITATPQKIITRTIIIMMVLFIF